MKVTVKGYDDSSENDVVLSVQAVDGFILGAVCVGDDDTGAWMTPAQLRELAREVAALADRVAAANKALATTTEGGAK